MEDWERERLAKHPWSMGGGGAADLKEALDEKGVTTLGSLADSVGITCFTLQDSVYILPESSFLRRGISRDNLRPMLVGDALRDWCELDCDPVLFPYDSKFKPLPEDPSCALFRYLWDYRACLTNSVLFGGQTKVQGGLKWYEYGRLTSSKLKTDLSITFACVATHNHFVLDRGGKVFNRHAPVIKLPAGATENDHLQLLGLLNSSLACFWMKQALQNRGSTVDQQGARQRTIPFEDFYEFSGTRLLPFPIPHTGADLARHLDCLSQEFSLLRPAAVLRNGVSGRQILEQIRMRALGLRGNMITLQEELDWQVYHFYGLTLEPLTYPGEVPPLNLGERAFEFVMARQIQSKELETPWFARHASKPITNLPAHWPKEYRRLVERRIQLIETDKNIGLIERPEYKRRWNIGKGGKTFDDAWTEFEQNALRGWLLNRLESERYWLRPQPGRHSPAELKSCRELARLAALDPEFQQVGELYADRKDFDVQKLVTELVLAESVPFLPILRYTDAGLRKRQVWERVWDKQRAEDRGEEVEIEVPPRYKKEDFHKDGLGKDGLWRLRGELDVPRERWISYPPLAQRQGDEQPSPVVTWAGYNHLDQALALAKYFDERKDRDIGSKEWMLPLLAGLEQLLPWLGQWHDAPDPAYEGQKMGEYFRAVVLPDALQTQGLTIEQCRAWRPPAPARKPRQTRKR